MSIKISIKHIEHPKCAAHEVQAPKFTRKVFLVLDLTADQRLRWMVNPQVD